MLIDINKNDSFCIFKSLMFLSLERVILKFLILEEGNKSGINIISYSS